MSPKRKKIIARNVSSPGQKAVKSAAIGGGPAALPRGKAETEEMLKLGRYLKSLRRDLGLSLREASKLSGMSAAHLCKVEKGTFFTSIGLHILVRLSRTYDIPLSAILEEAGLTESSGELPELAQYLRSKYSLPPQAVRDIETAKELVEQKYGKLRSTQPQLF